MKFTPAKRNNPCPICGDTSGDCRHLDNGLILCHDFIDGDASVNGWRWIKSSKCGVWGVFVRDQGKNNYDPEEWKQRQREREKRKKQKLKQKFNTALSAKERDKAIRRLHKYIGLTSRHRELLKKRGLTDQQIESGLYFSISPYQELPPFIPPNLPGVSWKGDRLATKHSGIACVIFDSIGRAIGWQLRKDNVSDANKYLWAKGTHGSHLPNGELPITLRRPEVALCSNEEIWLLEGFIKPDIACHRIGAVCLGAANGNFSRSPQSAKKNVADYNVVVITPDGGDVLNRHVMKRWMRQIEFFQSLGKKVKVAWWGQEHKEDGDLDEIGVEKIEKIVYLTPAEFLELSVIETSTSTDDDFVSSSFSKEPSIEPEPDAYAAYKAREKEQEVIDSLEEKRRREEWLAQIPQRNKNNYLKLKKYTATHFLEVPYLNPTSLRAPLAGEIFAVRSQMGTNKTGWYCEIIIKDFADSGVVVLGYRNSLLSQTKRRLNQKASEILGVNYAEKFKHLHYDEDAWSELEKSNGCLLLCVDSLNNIDPEFFDGKVLVLDEIVSVLRHLLKGQTNIKKHRQVCLEKFTEAIRRAHCVIGLDGLLNDWAIDYLQLLAGTSKNRVTKVENTYQPTPFNFVNLIGFIDAKKELSKTKHKGYHIAKLQECARPFIVCDSQIYGEALEKILIAQGANGLRVDSKTASIPSAKKGQPPTIGDRVREFLLNPDAWIKKNQPRYVIISPTGESGLDTSIRNYFDAAFGFFFHLHTDGQLQMIKRLRDPEPIRYIWTNQFVNRTSEHLPAYSPRQMKRDRVEFLLLDLAECVKSGDQEAIIKLAKQIAIEPALDYHEELLDKIDLIDRYERANLRECFIDALIAGGNKVSEMAIDIEETEMVAQVEAAKQIEKQATQLVKDGNALDIFTSPDIEEAEAVAIQNSFSAPWSEQCKAMKFWLKKRLPGIDSTPSWNQQFIRKVFYEDRQYLNHAETFWLLKHPQVAEYLQAEKWSKWLISILKGNQEKWIWDLRSLRATVDALNQLGILQLIDLSSGKEYKSDSPELIELVKKSRKREIALALGKQPSQKCQPITWLRFLLGRLGYQVKKRERKVNGVKKRFYYIAAPNCEYWEDVQRALAAKWDKYLSDVNQSQPDWEIVLNLASQSPQTQTSQVIEGVALPTNNIYINNEQVPPQLVQKYSLDLNTSARKTEPVSKVTPEKNSDQIREIESGESQTSQVIEEVALPTNNIYINNEQVPPQLVQTHSLNLNIPSIKAEPVSKVTPEKSSDQIRGIESGESQTSQVIEGVALPTNNIYINNEQVPPEIKPEDVKWAVRQILALINCGSIKPFTWMGKELIDAAWTSIRAKLGSDYAISLVNQISDKFGSASDVVFGG